MESYENTRFRITAWPSVRLPLRDPPHLEAVFNPDAEAFEFDFNAAPAPTTAPVGESYLKLAKLDLGDVDGMADFKSAYGELGIRGQFVHGSAPWAAFTFLTKPLVRELQAALNSVRDIDGRNIAVDTLVEFRLAIMLMRDVIAAWRSIRGEVDCTAHRWEFPAWQYAPWTGLPELPNDGPATVISMALAEGLKPFSPTVTLSDFDVVPKTRVSAWHLCCAELFNHIVEEAAYKVCANETCGRLFVRQEGRAKLRQHRTSGVKYCSSWCARAQAQRQYRRRRRNGA